MPEDRSRVLAAICQIFELGGTSLDAVEMISILQAKHGFAIEYSDVFEADTLAGLAGQAGRDDSILGTANPVPD
jgi:hypothetical protein